MRSVLKRHLLPSFLLMALVLPLLAACVSIQRTSDRSDAVPEDLAAVWETYLALQERYVDGDALDPGRLSAGAIRGMLEALDDPFAIYFDAENFQSSLDDIEGNFEGIGATVAMQDGFPTIIAPLPNSPAARAGLAAGDVIRAVEGESIEGLTLQEVVALIRGPSGSPVRLSVQSVGSEEVSEITIVRDQIHVASVTVDLLQDNIAHVRITGFLSQTADELKTILEELIEQDVRGIVLDLRNNPGGLVSAVIDVASEFLDDGLVGFEVDASGKRTDWQVKSGGQFIDPPMAVLVNRGSASCSEVLAGALQDTGRGTIVGTQTFGKGVVNASIRLPDGSGLYIPTAAWFTPNGTQIGRIGLSPDILVTRSQEDLQAGRDPQLDIAIETVRQALAVGR